MPGTAKVAVTGSTGFIGRHVVAALDRRGCSVTRVRRPATVLAELAELAEPDGRHTWVEVDFAAEADAPWAALGSPDVLIHLAWGGLPNYASLHHFEQELPLHYRWLRRLVDSGLGRLLVTGTCFEYGLQSGALEESLPSLPINPYGFAKDTLRRQLEFLQGARDLQLTWARLFYMHGEGQAEQSLLPQLQRAVARGDTRFPMSGGEQLRDYMAVDEVADCLVALAMARHGHGVVNVCSGRPVSVRRLVEHWITSNGWNIGLDLGRFPYSAHEPLAFWGDRRKLAACLASVPEPVATATQP